MDGSTLRIWVKRQIHGEKIQLWNSEEGISQYALHFPNSIGKSQIIKCANQQQSPLFNIFLTFLGQSGPLTG